MLLLCTPWITDPAPRYELDENGDAPHCLSRIGGSLSLTGPDLNPLENAKCCTSDVDCSTCRLYSGGLASRLSLRTPDLASRDAFANWRAKTVRVANQMRDNFIPWHEPVGILAIIGKPGQLYRPV